MCGIAGLLMLDGSGSPEGLIEKMIETLSHRGPDGQGVHRVGPVALGHRRLSIIDLSEAGNQPMCNEDGTIWITYNGEIYNFADLRPELEKAGHQFRSNTDTEVVLHAYEQWGLDCLPRFNGMFAFGLWDDNRKRLWVTRDRLGVKPLFYLHTPSVFAFGSEIKALLPIPGAGREMDYAALSYYLALNYTPAPRTLFADVRQLEPGQYMLVEADGRSTIHTYWQLEYHEPDQRNLRQGIEEFTDLLEDAVRIRLVSDVPFGSFLSGGVDSSSIAYWMSRAMHEPVKTFTISFQEESFNEAKYARQVATQIGADHYERVVDVDAAAILPQLVWHAEEPTADSSMLAVYYLAQMTREHVTMALSGDGADETIAGYETYQAYYLHRLYRAIPAFLRDRMLTPLIEALLPVSEAKVSFDFKLRRFLHSGNVTSEDAHALWRMIFNADQRRRLLVPMGGQPGITADVIDLYREHFQRSGARNPLDRMLYVDTAFYLPNDMLVKVDRMTMAHSLEVRVPFLDYRLVEFLARVPPQWKLHALTQKKYLLKAAMRSRLPNSILDRKKAGFNLPAGPWMKRGLKPFVMDTLSPRRVRDTGLLAPDFVQSLLDQHFAGLADNSHQIWCLLTLVLWHEKFMSARTV
jgi:asparagine synthase (glutamine-hydrolysing)